MADFDWRSWLFGRISTDGPTLAFIPAASVYGAGSLMKPPENKPFLVIRMGTEDPGPFPGVVVAHAVLWVHDEPGDYLRIGQALAAARRALLGTEPRLGQVVQVGAVGCRWMGDSEDLSDPDLGTITRNSTYDLLGKG